MSWMELIYILVWASPSSGEYKPSSSSNRTFPLGLKMPLQVNSSMAKCKLAKTPRNPLETCDECGTNSKRYPCSWSSRYVAYREPTRATMKANQVCHLATTCAISLCTENCTHYRWITITWWVIWEPLLLSKGEQKVSDLEQLVLPNIHRQLMYISCHLKSKLFSTWALMDCVRIFYKTQDPFARALQLSITACDRLQRRLPCPPAVIDVVGDLNSNELTSTCASIWWCLPEIPKACPAN